MRSFGKFLVISVIMRWTFFSLGNHMYVMCRVYAINVGCHPHKHVSYVMIVTVDKICGLMRSHYYPC